MRLVCPFLRLMERGLRALNALIFKLPIHRVCCLAYHVLYSLPSAAVALEPL